MSINAEAVPKKILDLMNVENITRENVASHLQVWFLSLHSPVWTSYLYLYIMFIACLSYHIFGTYNHQSINYKLEYCILKAGSCFSFCFFAAYPYEGSGMFSCVLFLTSMQISMQSTCHFLLKKAHELYIFFAHHIYEILKPINISSHACYTSECKRK